MTVLLVVVSLLGAFLGLVFLSQVTSGVGLICGACLLAILARVNQAADHHAQLMKALQDESARNRGQSRIN